MRSFTKATVTTTVTVGAITALLGMSGAAALAQARAVPAGDYCGPTEGFYGLARYSYAEVQLCLRFGAGGNQIRVNNTNNEYYWGGAWYSASAAYPASWTASGTVSMSGQSGTYKTGDVKQTSRSGSASGGSPAVLAGCGTYSVVRTFHQNGPYWTDPGNDIDAGTRTYQITVPC